MIDLHKIKKEAEQLLERNPDNAHAFEIYALAKLLMFIEDHGKDHHSAKESHSENEHPYGMV